MPSTPATTLLRFVNVRPVEKRDDAASPIHLLTIGDLTTPTLDDLFGAASPTAARTVARDFIASARYVSGYGAKQDWVAPLRAVAMALWQVDDAASLQALRAAAKKAGTALGVGTDNSQLQTVRARLWESLCCVFLQPAEDPRDRAELIRLIRAAEALHEPQAITSLESARRLRRARPVVPRRLLDPVPTPDAPSPGPGTGPTGPGGGLEPVPFDPQVLLNQVNGWRKDYLALDAALADIARQQKRATAAQPARAPVTRTVAPGVLEASTPSRGAFLPVDAVAQLSPTTQQLVAGAGFDFALDPVREINATLESQKTQLVDRIYQKAGFGGLTGLESHQAEIDLDDLYLPDHGPYVPVGESFTRGLEGSVGTVRPLGIGDLLILEETVLGYELGELSYIENVLQTESRSRVHRRLDRTETTYSTTSTTTETTERDLTTTERFALSSEVEKTVASDMSLNLGLGVSASYGVVHVDASTDFALSSSKSESERSATEYSQDVTDRALSSLTKSLTESVTQTIVNEVEETNTHGFDNTAGTGHVAGLYRFVDRKCQGQVLNYGKRLMMEFVVPEPAAFHVYGTMNPPPQGAALAEPEPLPADFGFKQIARDNYHLWVRKYQVKDVSPPPVQRLLVGKPLEQPSMKDELEKDEWTVNTRVDVLSVPAGYETTKVWVTGSWAYWDSSDYEMVAVVGQAYMNLKSDSEDPMQGETGEVPIAVKSKNVRAWAFTITLECYCLEEHLIAWKIATWQKVVEAYQALKSAYDAQQAATEIQQGNARNATPPELKQNVAQAELQRGCLVLLTNQHFASMDAVNPAATPYGYPELRIAESMREGALMQFHQQCFEWNQMTWTYYPYFWGSKEDWVARSQRTDTDPDFAAFLSAGAARVLVPVRPGYEEALTYYLETGDVWNGGEAPVIDDELYVSIVDEMAAALDVSLDAAVPYGDPWEYTLPTSLVMLQADSTLPTFGVPTA